MTELCCEYLPVPSYSVVNTTNTVAKALSKNIEGTTSKHIANKTNTRSKQVLVSCLHNHQANNMSNVKHKIHLI